MLPSKKSSSIHWPSVWQFSLSILAIFGLWSGALAFAALGAAEKFSSPGFTANPTGSFLMAATAAISGILLLPSAGYALLRMVGRPSLWSGPEMGFLRPTILILALPLVLLLGHLAVQRPGLAWLALPPLHILAIGLPVLWLLYLGLRELPVGSPQRMWGVFGSGLVLGPALILIGEVAALLLFSLVGMVWAAGQPDLMNKIESLSQNPELLRSSPETVLRMLTPYLLRPGVLFAGLTFGAVIVPLIEEVFKPIGVWLLAGRRLEPAAGFAAGVLSGAGYALFESLALTSQGEDWTFLVIARIGTAAIHILTAGLTGWALALAWKEGRYLRLGVTYLVAVLIHGLWNGLTLATMAASFTQVQLNGPELPVLSRLGTAAPAGLFVLAIGSFALLLWANWVLRRTQTATAEPVV